ncbi:hypothetical protein OG912_15545 [Streptomyces sp. NBC_00464]|uniref:hypothetical protein n=1 Tax=Streptomyces sp. NBC_00464 TaxID=2975751 RepID=UPI002E18F9BC
MPFAQVQAAVDSRAGSGVQRQADFDSPSGNGYGTGGLSFEAATEGQALTVTHRVTTSPKAAREPAELGHQLT